VVRARMPGQGAEGEDGPRPVEAEADVLARAQELQQLNDELRAAREQLSQQALRDPLTGLLVRSVFLEELSRALARLARHPHPLAVLFIDLDRLKSVNDNHGHAAGDELIRCCAERLRAGVRPSDPIARFGGDEFVILLDDLHDTAEAEAIAARVLDTLGVPCRLRGGLLVNPTASIGVATADGDGASAEVLISHADAAMYRAKQSGRAAYCVFDEDAYNAEAVRRRLEQDLRAAVGTDQLLLHYQPIIDLTTGATEGVEALLRWQHPRRGLLTAASFLEVAQGNGLMVELGRSVITQACEQLAEWDDLLADDAPRRMFVNLSLPELLQPGFDHQVAAALSDAGLPPERLVLEVTESGMADESPDVERVSRALSSLGCQLAIDDFGTGYSSLSRLAHLPADVLKLDRSFIQRLGRDRESTAIVSAVLLLAHDLRKTVVAEGVEDGRALVTLRDLGCEHAQGFHLAQPQPADEVTALLARAG
jgi:diguanylate cyclase (GGDEF)-like protein